MWHVIYKGKELYKSESKQDAYNYRKNNCKYALVVFYNE